MTPGRDLDYVELRTKHLDAVVPCTWLESNEPSYILYTSARRQAQGRAARRRRIRGRLAASMKHIYCGRGGDDVHHLGHRLGGGQLLHHLRTADRRHDHRPLRGRPIRPDSRGSGGRSCRTTSERDVLRADGDRVLKKHDPAFLRKYDLGSLRHLFLGGEPLDVPTHRWIAEALQKRSSITTGRPRAAGRSCPRFPRGEDTHQIRQSEFPGLRVRAEAAARVGRAEAARTRKPWWRSRAPAAGMHDDGWGDDERFVKTYFGTFRNKQVYSLSTGHPRRGRLLLHPRPHRRRDQRRRAPPRTREIEEASTCTRTSRMRRGGRGRFPEGPDAARVCVAKDTTRLNSARAARRSRGRSWRPSTSNWCIGRPKAIHFVTLLPKTRSGKTLRRSIQALAEGRDPGDLTTIEDPCSLEQIRNALNT